MAKQASDTSTRKSRLGRGLSTMLQLDPTPSALTTGETSEGSSGPLRNVAPDHIDRNPSQPRKQFHDEALRELADSFKVSGIIQPLVVREKPDGRYELIAGERRLRASIMAGLNTVPVLIREVDAVAQAMMALVENIQRENLNPVERAEAYQDLIRKLGLSHAELAGRLGEDRATISHHVRLLELSDGPKEAVRDGRLSVGHAKILVGVDDKAEQERLCKLILSQNLSVRNVERLVGEGAAAAVPPARDETAESRQRHLDELSRRISRSVGIKTRLTPSGKTGGVLAFHFKSVDQFELLLDKLNIGVDEE